MRMFLSVCMYVYVSISYKPYHFRGGLHDSDTLVIIVEVSRSKLFNIYTCKFFMDLIKFV